jgi:hypothetical protein
MSVLIRVAAAVFCFWLIVPLAAIVLHRSHNSTYLQSVALGSAVFGGVAIALGLVVLGVSILTNGILP